MTSSNPITNLANAIKGLISKHEEDKNHAEAGGTPQPIGKNLAAGTNNGYYARADHVHTVEFDDVLNTPNALDVVDNLTTDDGSKPLSAKQGKWLNNNKLEANPSQICSSYGIIVYNDDYDYNQHSILSDSMVLDNDEFTVHYIANDGYISSSNEIATKGEISEINTALSSKVNTSDSRLTDARTPTSHASTATTYGVATTANYGHTKIVQNLTTDDANGLALGAGQGKALKTAIDAKSTVSVSPTKTSGIEIGSITVDGTSTTLYQQDNNTTYTAESTATNIKMNGTQSAGDSSTYARGNHVHPTDTSRAPTSHASTGTGYGIGTTTNYGHNKIIDDATKSSLTNGESLSAHMGYILNNQDVEYVVSTHTSSTSTWTGTCSKLRKLEAGTKIYYRLNQDPTTTDVTLNLTLADSTTTGAKNVYFGGTRLKNQYPKYAVIGMVFDGSNWIVINQYTNTNTTYSASTGLNLSSNAFSVKYGSEAGTACQGNDSRLSNARTPTSHTHGNITNAGAIGSTANLPIITDTNGVLKAGSFGTAANTFCQGNDSRLSNSRTPTFNQITANANSIKDLNTYRTGGFYYNGNNAESKYIIHCPNSNGTSTPYDNNKAFFLLVETWGASNNNYVKQTLTYYDTNKTYTRTKTGNSDANTDWTAWTEISKDTNTTYSVATQSANGLMSSSDKTKLDGVATGANNYSHPSTHAATMITDANAHTNIGSSANANQGAINTAIDTALSNKQAKGNYAAASHSHSYLPLTGGTLTGNVIFPDANNSTNNTAAGNIPWAGTPTYNTDVWTTFKAKKSGFYTFTDGSKWWNLISIRHRNGSGDATNYGAYIKTSLQDDGNLIWAKQKGGNSFMAERTILDSSNYSTYANKTSISAVSGVGTTDKDKIGSVTIDGTEYSWYTPKLNNTVTSTSTTQAATANAVKTAYDKGNHSHPYASSSHNHDSNYVVKSPSWTGKGSKTLNGVTFTFLYNTDLNLGFVSISGTCTLASNGEGNLNAGNILGKSITGTRTVIHATGQVIASFSYESSAIQIKMNNKTNSTNVSVSGSTFLFCA